MIYILSLFLLEYSFIILYILLNLNKSFSLNLKTHKFFLLSINLIIYFSSCLTVLISETEISSIVIFFIIILKLLLYIFSFFKSSTGENVYIIDILFLQSSIYFFMLYFLFD